MSEEWRFVPAGSVTKQRRETVRLQPGIEYRAMGVRWHGKGAYSRGTITTETVKAKTLYRARAGDFVFNRIDTQKGAFDVVPHGLDGSLATNEFPLYEVDRKQIDARFLLLYFQQAEVRRQIGLARAGSEGRARWKEDDFEAWAVPLPPPDVQARIIEVVAAVDAQIAALQAEADALKALLNGHKEARFSAFNANSPRKRLGDVMNEVKRPVDVDATSDYRQIGVRSHGRGVFLKDAVSGNELGSKKVYWVEPGDLVINIVFAWEGAVAVIPSEIVGYCGSHRFPTYRRPDGGDVEFLRFMFSTKIGVGLLAACSPGGAGRNRTLNRRMLLASEVAIPSPEEQAKVVAELHSMEAAVVANRAEVESLYSTRAALLSAMLNREIEISQAESALT